MDPYPHRDSPLPPRTRRILHVDVDAFLASVEQEGDSRAARKKREEIARVLLGFTPRVEVAAIDDFMIDLTGTTRLLGAACDAAECIRSAVLERTSISVTIGIGTNRTMARLAGKLAKPGGIAEILPGGERAFLSSLSVRHLPGVGPAIARKLDDFAIGTAGDLALVSREVLFASFGSRGLVLHDRARGIDPDPVESTHALDAEGRLQVRPPRSIQRESTFEPEESSRRCVGAMLAYLVDRAAARVRAHRSVAGSVEVRLLYVDPRPAHRIRSSPDPGRWKTVRRRPSEPTDSTDALTRCALELLHGLPRRRALVKRVGVELSALGPTGGWQGRLFSDPEGDRAPAAGGRAGAAGSRADRVHRLDSALDELRARHGFGRVLRGASLPLAERFTLGPEGFRLRTPSVDP